MATFPTTLRGSVGEFAYDDWLVDALEHVPSLIYPLSNAVYAQMRRDPQLAAVLAGYTLQIRRATWVVDPAGCRPEVAQLVADDLGLPVMGDDKPQAARVRGVSWEEHLRTALLCLVYGHSGFEMQAQLRDGLIRLIALAERPAHTITNLHTDPKSGAFLGITQDVIGKLDVPQIRADRMVWYAHEREGNSYQGQSLLRPAYGPWLIKKDMQRVLATSSRRFGMGVPTMKAKPGTQPTAQQMTAALGLATSARVGETGGAAVPPDFDFALVGLSGSTPDTLGFIKYLDQQASRMALMGHLDLGETSNGSRALGDTFVDLLMMALQTIATAIADTVTRQAAARLVEWNWGEDEPVPAVKVSDIGSRREVTAESLNLLLGSGALSADPALEAHIRREWRLPEREAPPAPAPTAVPPAEVPPPNPPVTPPVAARARSKRRQRPGQLALFATADDPEPGSPAAIQQQWQDAKDDLLASWPDIAQPMVDQLADQAQALAESGDVAGLGNLAVSAGVIAATALPLTTKGNSLAKQAASGVIAEAANQGVSLDDEDTPGADRIQQTADAVASVIASGYASGATRIALQLAGADPQQVRDAVAEHTESLSASANGLVGDNVGALLSAAQHAGRLAVLQQKPAKTYTAVEVNDSGRCEKCAEVDGTVYDTLAAALEDYPAAGFFECQGMSRCRGHVRPDWT